VLDLADFDPVMKQYYLGDKVEDLVYPDNIFYALAPKHEKFPGRNLPIPTKFGNPQGRSADFSIALGNVGNSQYEDFVLTRKKDYSVYRVDNETLESSEGEGAFMEALTAEADNAFQESARSVAIAMWRNGTGSRGAISAASNVGTATITLANINDISNFEVGMKLQASAADGGALRSAGATVTVVAVNRSTGTITASGNWSAGIAAVAAGDFLYQHGDAANGGANVRIDGYEAWIPRTDPTSTLFLGVNRSVDVTRLGGIRYDGSAQNPEEALVDMLALMCREGANPDYVFQHTSDFANVEKSLIGKAVYDMAKVGDEGKIAFRGIRIAHPKGSSLLLGDQNAPSGRILPVTLKTWKLCSIGKAPKLLKYKTTNTYLTETTLDAIQGRVGFYGNLGCWAPGKNGNGTAPV
jgi:hypothetical protein